MWHLVADGCVHLPLSCGTSPNKPAAGQMGAWLALFVLSWTPVPSPSLKTKKGTALCLDFLASSLHRPTHQPHAVITPLGTPKLRQLLPQNPHMCRPLITALRLFRLRICKRIQDDSIRSLSSRLRKTQSGSQYSTRSSCTPPGF